MRSVIIQASIKQTGLDDMHEVLLPVILNLSILKIKQKGLLFFLMLKSALMIPNQIRKLVKVMIKH